jgi:hypothetical protein
VIRSPRSRRLRLAAVAALAASALVPSVADAAGTGEILITGGRTAYVDVTLRSPVTIDVPASSMVSRGTFVGFYAESLDRPTGDRYAQGSAAGLVTIRDYHPPGAEGGTLDLLSGSRTLNPGRYRVYLIADAKASVRLVTSGSDKIRLTPSRPATARAAVRTDILQNPLVASNSQSLVVPSSRSIAFSSVVVGKFRAFVGTISACFALPGKDCGSATTGTGDGSATMELVSPTTDLTFRRTTIYAPGALRAGTYDTLQDSMNATTFQFASGAAFVLALS